jgi:hypothetical protein
MICVVSRTSRYQHFKGTSIETVLPDIPSEESIKSCAGAVAAKTRGTLDILINNSSGCYSIPLANAP